MLFLQVIGCLDRYFHNTNNTIFHPYNKIIYFYIFLWWVYIRIDFVERPLLICTAKNILIDLINLLFIFSVKDVNVIQFMVLFK